MTSTDPTVLALELAIELAATKAALAEADAVIFKLNSGEELQTLMKINNECVARISELEAALKLFAALVGHMSPDAMERQL